MRRLIWAFAGRKCPQTRFRIALPIHELEQISLSPNIHIQQNSDIKATQNKDYSTILNSFCQSQFFFKYYCSISKTRASRWRAIAYPSASAIAYLRAHRNSNCVPPVLVHRAIICDSFKVLARKSLGGVVWQSNRACWSKSHRSHNQNVVIK